MILSLLLTLGLAHASPTIDSLNVQGFLKKADNTAVTDGTYTMAFGVFQNGVMLWGKSYPVAISNGLLSQTLTGNGANLSSLPAGTGMNADYSAANLQASLLVAGGAGAVSIRVYAVTAIDASNPQFDVGAAAVPTSMLAELTKGVVPGSVTTAGLATTAKTDTSAGPGDAGKLVLLDGSGLLAVNMIPPLPATSIGSGQVGLTHGGTGSTDGSITGSGAISYMSAVGAATTVGNSGGASSLVLQSGTGGVLINPGSTSGTVTVGNNAATGNSVFGNGGGASATLIQSGTGGVLLSPAAGGSVRVTNGLGLNLVRGTGSTTINSANNPSSYTLTLPATSGTAGQYLQTDGTGVTAWIRPSLSSLGAAASGANTDITGLNPTGVLNLGNTATTAITMLPAGNITMNPVGVIAVGGANTTGVAINPAGNVSISPTTGGITFNPSGAITFGGITTTAITMNPGGSVNVSPTGTLTLGGASNVVNNGLVLNGSTSGAITLRPASTTTSHTYTLPATQGASGSVLRNDGSGGLTWITAGGGSGYAASGNNTDITGLNPSGVLNVGNTSTTGLTMTPAGPIVINPTSTISIGGNNTTGVNISPASSVSISPSSGGVTLGPNGALTLGGALTSAVALSPGGPVTIAPSGTLTLAGTSNQVNNGLTLNGATSGSLTLKSSATTSPHTLTFPAAQGVSNSILRNDGSGALAWVTAGTSGFAASGNNTDITGLNPTGALNLGGAATTTVTLGGSTNQVNNGLALNGATSGALTLKSAATTTSHTLTLPASQGPANSILRNDGAGALTWITAGASGYAASGANTDITSLDPTGPLALGNTNATNITITPSGTLTAGGTSTGASTFGNNGANAIATFRGGALGASAQAVLTSGGSGANAVLLNASVTGGSIALTANTTGNISLTQGTTSGVLNLGSTASTGGVNLQGAGTTTVTSSRAVAGAVTISASAAAGGIAVTPGATGALTLNSGATSGTVTLGNTASTGAVTIGNTGAASTTTIQSGSTGKIKLQASGSTGVAFTSMGVCSIATFLPLQGANAKTCANLPAGAAVSCSPASSQGGIVTWGAWASAAGTVTINMSDTGAFSTWTCMWVQP